MSACVLFRTHYSKNIGYGHVKRCLSLASVLEKKGVDVVFLLDITEDEILPELKEYPCYFYSSPCEYEFTQEMSSMELNLTCKYLEKHTNKMVFFDKYSVVESLLISLKDKGVHLASFDDFGIRNSSYDILIDHNYEVIGDDPYLNILGSLMHCALSYDFYKCVSDKKFSFYKSSKLSLFINLGSGDVLLYEDMILAALMQLNVKKMFNIYWLVSGRSNIYGKIGVNLPDVNRLRYIDDMPDFLSGMDLAVGSCGVNSLERCCMGVPSLLAKTVENQERNYRTLINEGLGFCFNDEEDIASILEYFYYNKKALKKASELCRTQVDGLGVMRILNKIETLLVS